MVTRTLRLLAPIGVGILCGCAALQQVAALRSVRFAFGDVAGVRVAGVAIGPEVHYGSLGVNDIARLASAIARHEVPVEMLVNVAATNPEQNKVAARMVTLGWKLFVDDRPMLDGTVSDPVSIAPGQTARIPVAVRFDLLAITGGGARDLFDTALAIAGYGTAHKELRMELVPTIETALGPITYPAPIVVRR